MPKSKRPMQAQLTPLISKLNAADIAAPGRAAVLNVAQQLIELATQLVATEAARFPARPPKKDGAAVHHKCLRCGAGAEWLQ
jgi:hypothetical protein